MTYTQTQRKLSRIMGEQIMNKDIISESETTETADNSCKSENYDLLDEGEIKLLDKICNLMTNCIQNGSINQRSEKIIQIFSYLSNKLYAERYGYIQLQMELEKQKGDLEHFLLPMDVESEEYTEALKEIGGLIVKRRNAKDVCAWLEVAYINIGKIAGFVSGMKNRKYTAKSSKYGNHSSSVSAEGTRIKLNTIKNMQEK